MPEYEKAMRPEDITRLFIERSNAGDAAGVAALYEEEAVMAYPHGRQTVGRAAIRALWEKVLAYRPRFEPEQPLPTLVSGDIALTSTPPKDGARARAQVVRRQPDGSWLRLLDQPEFVPPDPLNHPPRTLRNVGIDMRKWLPLMTICLGTFMLLIDVTIVNVALPDMVGDLDASFGALQWVINAYALALGALVLGAGSIADLVGHRRAYITGLAIFATSSLICGLAPNPGVLIAARTVQGIGAAAMFATTLALLNSAYAGRDRGSAYGIWGAVSGASAAVGPILGGLLTDGASWRWIFFVNLPISAIAIALCVTTLTRAHMPGRGRVDIGGMVSFTGAAVSATYALILANEDGWSDAGVWWLLMLAAVLLAVFVAIESRSQHPMFDLALLRNRSFVGVLLGGLLLTFAAFATFTYTSIWLQSVLGMSAIGAGLTGLPMSITAFGVSAVLGRMLHGRRPDLVIGAGLLFVGLGSLLTAVLVHGSAHWPALVPGLAVIGIGVGLATPILGSVSMSLVPAERGGMAAGAVNTTRQLGFAFGVAALGSVFAARAQSSLSGRGIPDAAHVAHAIAGGQTPGLLHAARSDGRQLLDSAAHAAAVTGVQATFAVAGAVGILASLLVVILMRPARAHAIHEDERPPVPQPTRQECA